jgi:hypothetical protein
MNESSLPVSPDMLTAWDGRRPHWQRELQAWKRCLLKDFPIPPGWKVSVRTCKTHPDKCYGTCEQHFEIKTYRILIQKDDWFKMVDTLWHEWAHIHDHSHGDEFHIRYGQIYRRYIEGTE